MREKYGDTLVMIAVGAYLGYMAFGSYWHGALFGFLAYGIQGVGNRVVWELRQTQDALKGAINPLS